MKQPFHDKTHIARYYLNIKRTNRIPILLIGAVLQIWFPTAVLWITFDLAVGTNITMIHKIIYAYPNFLKNQKERRFDA